jgi:pimeloyl-ACP methyl ester carboxylesterase
MLAPTFALRIGMGRIADPVDTFYETIEPADGARKGTVVMVHGGSQSGSCYVDTPDGRPGWAPHFAQAGYRAVLPDWPGCGRSGHVPDAELTGEIECRGLGALIEAADEPVVLATHSMSGTYGWKLPESHAPRIAKPVAVAPGLPGNIQPAPTILRDTETEIEIKSLQLRYTLSKTAPFRAPRGRFDAKKVGGSTRYPAACAAAQLAGMRAIPANLLLERLSVGARQLKVTRTEGFRGKRVLVFTGSHDTDHAREVDAPIVDWLNGIGARAEFRFLADRGIVGNGHMLVHEDNSDALARMILDWIEDRAPPSNTH